MPDVVVDAKAIEELAADFTKAKRALIDRLSERGHQLLVDEVPERTGNLKQGVAPPEVDYEKLEAILTVSASSAAIGSRGAKVFGADGKEKKTVTLRPSPRYNYAEVTARGNKDAVLKPKNAKAFLIPVPTAPNGEGYLLVGGQVYVVRRSKKGMKPNPYDERAAKRLEGEQVAIAEAVLSRFV